MEGGIGGLLGGIFMRGNKSHFLRQSALPLSLKYYEMARDLRFVVNFAFANLRRQNSVVMGTHVTGVGPYRMDTQNNCRKAHSLEGVKESSTSHLRS